MILLGFLVTSLLTAGQGAAQLFTLRNQLDSNVLEAMAVAEKELSNGLLNDAEPTKLSPLVVMELKPLYFHFHDLAVQLSDMYLTSSDFVLEETNIDVLGHRMMPLVHFHWVEVKGKLKAGFGNNTSQKSEFRQGYRSELVYRSEGHRCGGDELACRANTNTEVILSCTLQQVGCCLRPPSKLVQNHLTGNGVMSLSVDLVNIIWSYLYFKPNDSSIEIVSFRDVAIEDIFTSLSSAQFSDLLSKKLQRDISNQLTKAVSKNINQRLKKTSKLMTLEPYSEEIRVTGVNNTENANTFIDSLLKIGGAMIHSKFGDRIMIPEIQEGFSEKFLVTFRGSFRATEGAAIGTSSVYRVGDIVFGYDNESLLHFYGTLGFKELHLFYEHYKAEMWGVGPSGSLDTTLSPLSVLVHVHLNTSSKTITLEKFKISNAGDLEVRLTGLGGMISWLVSRVTTWVVGLYRDQVLQLLESQYALYGRDVFATYSIEELLNGGKNEAYVL